jgi:hypothetical protein
MDESEAKGPSDNAEIERGQDFDLDLLPAAMCR